MGQHCTFFFSTKKCFALVRGYLDEKIFQRGYITEKSLGATVVDCLGGRACPMRHVNMEAHFRHLMEKNKI